MEFTYTSVTSVIPYTPSTSVTSYPCLTVHEITSNSNIVVRNGCFDLLARPNSQTPSVKITVTKLGIEYDGSITLRCRASGSDPGFNPSLVGNNIELYSEDRVISLYGLVVSHDINLMTEQEFVIKTGRNSSRSSQIKYKIQQNMAGNSSFQSRYLSRTKETDPESKARGLLREMIGEMEFRRYIKRGFITATGKSGILYKISNDGIISFEKGQNGKLEKHEHLCIVFKDVVCPPTDAVIMRKMLVEYDEFALRRIACIRPYKNITTITGQVCTMQGGATAVVGTLIQPGWNFVDEYSSSGCIQLNAVAHGELPYHPEGQICIA